MRPFDSNDYRRRVLAPIHARGGAEQSDPFEIYDIPLEDVPGLSDDQVRERIDTVWAFWQRSRDHPRYRGVIIALLGLHAELSAALITAGGRADLARRVAEARAARNGERYAELDAAIRRLLDRFGGLPENKIAGLRALAAARGVDESDFARRIRRHRVVPAATTEKGTAAAPVPVPPEVMRQLRADLDELGRIAGTTPPRSLFDLLGVRPGADRAEIRAVREAAVARNRERRPDRRRALLDDLLAAVKALLVDGDPAAYFEALVGPVTELLRPKVAVAVLLEDRLLPETAAELVAEAEAEGLDAGRARSVLAALAAEHGIETPVGPVGPGRPSTGAQAGPSAGSMAGSTAGPVPTPGRAAEWQAALSRARAALRTGRPVVASDEVARAREYAGETLPPIRAVGDEVERVIQMAGDTWRAVAVELAANRFGAVLGAVDELARVASDVPGPDGRMPAEVLAVARQRCAAADELVTRARAAAPDERVRLAREALGLVADHPDASTLLVGTGSAVPSGSAAADTVPPVADVQPPTALSARWNGSSVVVSWQPTATPGQVRYRVRRITADGNARAVGVTSATSIEDGGVRAGEPIPGYEVLAGVDGAWSPPARWPRDPAGPADTAGPAGSVGQAESAAVPPPGPRTEADDLGPVAELRLVDGRLRWTWPAGCTEIMVVSSEDGPPAGPTIIGATARKVTNTRYDIDGGVELPTGRPLYVALFACIRRGGTLVFAGGAAARGRIDPSGSLLVEGPAGRVDRVDRASP